MCGCCASRSQRKKARNRKIKSKPKGKAQQTRHSSRVEQKQAFDSTKFKSEKEFQGKSKTQKYEESEKKSSFFRLLEEDEEWQKRREKEKVKQSQVTTTTQDTGIFDCCLCCLQPGTSDGVIIVNERPHEKERREQRLKEENAQRLKEENAQK